MITITSLKHPTMIAKLRLAMRLAGMGKGELMNGHGHRTYITNRHGHNVVRCSYWPDTKRFDFWIGGSGRCIDTDTIKAVLQSVQGKLSTEV